MRRLRQCFQTSESGSASVEFAIIAPLIAGGLMAAADYGLKFQARSDLAQKIRLAVEGVIREGDAPDAIVAFLAANGERAVVARLDTGGTSVEDPSAPAQSAPEAGAEAAEAEPSQIPVAGSADNARIEIMPTSVCFTLETMTIAPRDEALCAAPEDWIRIFARAETRSLTGKRIPLSDTIDLKVE